MDPVLILLLGALALLLSSALIDYAFYHKWKERFSDLETTVASGLAQGRVDRNEILRAATQASNALTKARRAEELIEKYNEWAGTELGVVRSRLSEAEDKLAKLIKGTEATKAAKAANPLPKPRKVRL